MKEYSEYCHFTGPQELEKSIHTLEGIIKGIAIDCKINKKELEFLNEWLAENADVANRHPLNEVIPVIEKALKDGIIDDNERKDIIWLCEQITSPNSYFDGVTTNIQRLQAILTGIAADGVITEGELSGLRMWLSKHKNLRTCWPYDELDSLILSIMEDGEIDEEEHKQLLSFFREFMAIADDKVLANPPVLIDSEITGVCTVCPKITFKRKVFCFTGKSARARRREIAVIINSNNGIFTKNISKSVDYLIVGADGNPAWAYTCYGRKVEAAINYRKEGFNILIVHENDFWDAVEDLD